MIRSARWAIPLLLFPILFSVGCAKEKDTAVVMGHVTVDGQPMKGGTVVFLSPDPESRVTRTTAPLGTDGSFLSGNVPVGDIKVGVRAEPLDIPSNADPQQWKARYDAKQKEIGEHYADPQTSGITIEVKPGEQEHDIELKSSGS